MNSDGNVSVDEASPWRKFAGIRVLGDVHGEAKSFEALLDEARASGLFVVQLGDLVDRGPDSVGALRLALDLLERGAGLFLLGNHDDKLRRALRGNAVKAGLELRRTLDALAASSDRDSLLPRVRSALEAAPLWLRAGNLLFVHGAFEPAMLRATGPQAITPRRTADKCRWLALHGEGSEGGTDDNLPIRTYHWIDLVPPEITVIIGHDVKATDRIVEERGVLGGRVLFCDTGAGKGGKLSFIDLSVPA